MLQGKFLIFAQHLTCKQTQPTPDEGEEVWPEQPQSCWCEENKQCTTVTSERGVTQ